MPGMLRKGMSWLGLGPEEDYDDYYDDGGVAYDDDEPGEAGAVAPAMTPMRPRAVPVANDWDDQDRQGLTVLPPGEGARAEPRQAPLNRGVVRPLPVAAAASPQVVVPVEFNDAQQVGDLFKRGRPVIVNLQGLERDLARRLLDFTSGVAYGLGGRVEKVASHVYLLSPADVDVSDEDRRRIKAGDYEA